MSTYYKILLIIIVLAYVVSPIDLIPDIFFPYIGWIDDTFLIGTLIYYLRFGRLPNFFNKQSKKGSKAWNNPGAKNKNYSNMNQGFNKKKNSSNFRSSKKSPDEILGVKKNASKEEIQAAYRKAVKEYHPDRVAHLGKDLQELANKRFIEIKEAYDILMNIYNKA
ncbi:MAG: DnaJ domain-containing protein [Thermodesulfobacteriota bacterium]|nr:DnaJ domain-containing protein [Thermodesulfobacteriota bacterium]